MCADTVLNTTPDFTSSHTFSTDDLTGGFDGLLQGDLPDGDTTLIDFNFSDPKNADGTLLYPVNTDFGYVVTDFVGAIEKTREDNPEYEEGWVGDLKGEGDVQAGIVVSDAPTDTFKTPAVLGTWLAGLGGNSVKASTEHYVVMQNILSDAKFPDDPDAVYDLDDDLYVIGGKYDGMLMADAINLAGDANDDGVADIKDVLQPNETEITENIAASTDYSVTLKDDGKLLYRWGNMIKKPNDIRLDIKLDLPDEFTEIDPNSGLLKLFKITSAELATDHTVTNNPNDQIRPEGLENEAAIGQLPGYLVVADWNEDGKGAREVWVSDGDFYAGDGTFYPAGTVLRDDFLADNWETSDIGSLGAEDGAEGFTNAWYTTMDREPFEPVLNEAGDDYIVGGRWRLEPNKYGQDLPGVEIPLDPSLPPPPTKDEIKYEVGVDTTTVINLLDWEAPVSRLSISAGYQHNSGSVDVNGLNMTNDLDVSFYVKGDVKPATLYDTSVLMDYEEIAIAAVGAAVTGGDADDYLAGQGGNDFFGGADTDLFVLSYGTDTDWRNLAASTIADFTIGEDVIGLIDFNLTALSYDDIIGQSVEADGLHLDVGGYELATLTGVTEELSDEDFMFINRALEPTVTGTAGDDLLVGDEGDNLLEGLAGNDTLYGLEGDDTLDGGTGDDYMEGGDGSDLYYVDSLGDTVVELPKWLGTDTISSSISYRLGSHHVENLELTGSAVVGAGNTLNNHITGTVGNNILDGGRGVDTMEGGAGHDVYIVRTPGDNVVENPGAGLDTVKAFLSYVMDLNVERLALQAVYNSLGDQVSINGFGNEQANTIIGNNVDNVIQGRGGLDTLKGQLGADTFAFVEAASASNTDRIIDFNTNVANEGDMLMFRSSVYTGLTAGSLDANAFHLGTAAADADDRFIFDQASGNLWYDEDGTGAVGQELVAYFENNATLTADDFVIV